MARHIESEEYTAATGVAREIRGVVAEQLAELVREGDRMGSREEVQQRIVRANLCNRKIAESKGRQKQARVNGSPVGPHAEEESEWRELAREAVMQLAVSCATWVAAMDYEKARVEQEPRRSEPEEEPVAG